MTATKRIRDEKQKQILPLGAGSSFLRYGSLPIRRLHGHAWKG